MTVRYFRDLLTLFIGDVVVFAGSLWLALVARHFVAPNSVEYFEHLVPFSVLFVLWLLVFVIVGLYDKTVALFEDRLPGTVLQAQVINFCIALLFFFLAPIDIQPKTVLALYFAISTSLIVIWRLGIFKFRSFGQGVGAVVVVGYGHDIDDLRRALQVSEHTRLAFRAEVDPRAYDDGALVERVASVVAETHADMLLIDPRVLHRFPLGTVPEAQRIDTVELFEALLGRAPLSLLEREAFLKTAQRRESAITDSVKRGVDVVLALTVGTLSLVVYPFVWLAIYLEDRGSLFVRQERVGKNGRIFPMYKFRSMTGNDSGQYGASGKTTLRVTKVGAFLRKSRIDELPQLWSVLVGDQSLVGPRPELPALVARYAADIPLYDLRHSVTPGLSGWAQIYHQAHPHHGADVVETERKLSYDLYYIAHRSVLLDLDIVLKTIKALALRLGA
jgi:lipopolysaccharide/colanic/teichoic acid biosynthesis glycosyltransferase